MNNMFLMIGLFVFISPTTANFIHPGTPKGITTSYDCSVRKAAYAYGKKLMPHKGDFKSLFDALQLENGCNVTSPTKDDIWVPGNFPEPKRGGIYASPEGCDIRGDGTKNKPFLSLKKAVIYAKNKKNSTIILREGSYFLSEQIELNESHSGLTIQNAPGEMAVVSGGVSFHVDKNMWKPYVINKGSWKKYKNKNNVYGRVENPNKSSEDITFLGIYGSIDDCIASIKSKNSGGGRNFGFGFSSVTYHEPEFDAGAWAKHCYGVKNKDGGGGWWSPTSEQNVISAKFSQQNTWYANISKHNIDAIPGLRINDGRAIRAKYPDGDPENPALYPYTQGWVTSPTNWLLPQNQNGDATTYELVTNGTEWPSVYWPLKEDGGSTWTGEGDFGDYHIGVDGYCSDIYPAAGYWCSMFFFFKSVVDHSHNLRIIFFFFFFFFFFCAFFFFLRAILYINNINATLNKINKACTPQEDKVGTKKQ